MRRVDVTTIFPSGARRGPALLLVATALAVYLLPLAGRPPATNPNELVRVELAVAMAELGTVDIDRPARVYGLSEDVARRNGRLLADKAPGLSIAAVPIVWIATPLLPAQDGTALPSYWPLRHVATGVAVAFVTVLAAVFLGAAVGSATATDWRPLFLLAAFATPLWTYGTVFFGHAPAAALITVAWILLIGAGGRTDCRPRRGGALIGGLAAGAAIATEYPTGILVAVILGTLVARRTPSRLVLLVAAGIAAGLLPVALYHHVAFGAPWLTGYAFKADEGFRTIHATGVAGVGWPTVGALWGVLGSAARGLFFYAPILLTAPVGLVLLARRFGSRVILPLITAALGYFGFAAGFVDWQAGWCAAARHLTPVVPVLLIPVLTAASAARRSPTWSALVAVLAAVSVVRVALTVVLTPFFPPEFSHPLTQLVVPSLAQGFAAPTVIGIVLGWPSWAVWLGLAALLVGGVGWAATRLAHDGARWLWLVATVALVGQLTWFVVQGRQPNPGLEGFRRQVLSGLGHPVSPEPGLVGMAPEAGGPDGRA
ncbi:MAG: hypothetical protein PVG53_09335, partial [Holophagae bacterium]